MNAEKRNAYRNVLARRMGYFRIVWLAYLLLLVARRFFGPSFEEGMIYGMLMGLLSGGLFVSAIYFVQLRRAMKDEQQLLRLYNAEHDERKAAIRAKAGFPLVVVFGLTLIAAAMVASFFNGTVTVTLVAVALAELLACLALKAWYTRHM